MRDKNHLLLSSLFSFNIKKICLQSCTGVDAFQYTVTHLQKATTFSRFPTSTGRELQPPSSWTSLCVYYYVGIALQKDMTFSLPPRPRFINFQTRFSWYTTIQMKASFHQIFILNHRKLWNSNCINQQSVNLNNHITITKTLCWT